MARVIGRKDLAEEFHRVLAKARIGADLYAGTPIGAGTQDGSDLGIVVLSGDIAALQTCGWIRKAARRRPVLAVTPSKWTAVVEARSAGARGRDAYVVWPASGEAIRAAGARAMAAAGTRRPRFPRAMLASMLAAAAAVATVVVAIIHDELFLQRRDGLAVGAGTDWRALPSLGGLLLGCSWVLPALHP